MRFVVVNKRDRYLIMDTDLMNIAGIFTDESRADAAAFELNRNPPPGRGVNREWSMVTSGDPDLSDFLLNQGFEPFAVDKGVVYFRIKLSIV